MNIAIIPCRSGSRRIQRKNFREFHGRPILSYSVDAALQSGLFDGGVWVSAEEKDWGEIGIAAPRAGWIRRYPDYALDEVGTQEVVRHALEVVDGNRQRAFSAQCRHDPAPEYVCCIYATAPMLVAADLIAGYDAMRKLNEYAFVPGWFYWGRSEWFGVRPLPGNGMLGAPERAIDINIESDWQRAEEMYAALHGVTA